MEDKPYSLADEQEKNYRHSLLKEKHILPLTNFVYQLRKITDKGQDIPFFDPLDGGINAKVLFILEAPGAQAVRSGFISRNNPDPSARNFYELCKNVGLQRNLTVLWNIIPWYIGDANRIRPSSGADIKQGLPWLLKLLALLMNLKYIILVWQKSQKALVWLSSEISTPMLAMFHTSNKVKNSYPESIVQNEKVLKMIVRNLKKK